ncbi:hypothetical protein BYT27DRAFT_7183269 [Phlegmacium glaucopus]|nr:hypothetical protein BYT27DRAFT_7183269 [Phlegmacium glaucopus]
MVNSNTSVKANIVEVPADRTTPPDSPNDEMQDNRQAQQIYYIQNYYTNSFNNRNFHMRNCGNHNYRRTTVIDYASSNELPYPQPDEALSGPTPSTRPDSHPIQTNPKDIADVSLPTNYQPRLDPARSPRPVTPSDSSDYNVEHLDPSLAPVPSIQLSGSTLADVLTPRGHDQLVPSDVSIPRTKCSMSDPPTRSLFFGIRNSEQPSPSSPNSSLVVPNTSRSHISIPVHYVMLFSSAILFCLVFFIIALHKRVLKEYINWL